MSSSSASNACGKAERKWYGDGSERLKLHVRDLGVPDGSQVSVTIASRQVTTLAIHGGRLEFNVESSLGLTVPDAQIGEILAIEYGGEILVSGEFQYD